MNNISRFLFRQFRKEETSLHQLEYIFWECTTRCNLHCRHCGSDCSAQAALKDMPLEDFLGALKTLPKPEKDRRPVIAITGGEPLLRPDIAACGIEIRKLGYLWGMVSNGMGYDESMQRTLLDSGISSLTISLDGPKEQHNLMRGSSLSFDRALNAITLAAHEPSIDFDVVTCVHPGNLPYLEEILALLGKAGVKAWRLFTIAPIGRAATDHSLQLSDTQVKEMMDFIVRHRQVKDSLPIVQFSCEAYTGPYECKVRQAPFFCRAGINIASILIDGSIGACPNIDRRYVQGNIYKDNFSDVWESRFQIYRDRKWMRTGPCAGCKAYQDCIGGAFHLRQPGLEGPLVCHFSQH